MDSCALTNILNCYVTKIIILNLFPGNHCWESWVLGDNAYKINKVSVRLLVFRTGLKPTGTSIRKEKSNSNAESVCFQRAKICPLWFLTIGLKVNNRVELGRYLPGLAGHVWPPRSTCKAWTFASHSLSPLSSTLPTCPDLPLPIHLHRFKHSLS